MDVELLVVPNCHHEAAALLLLRTALDDLHLTDTQVATTVISTQNQAVKRGFTRSPTFLIAGADPFAEPGRPAGIACRLYRQANGLAGVPELGALREAIRAAIPSDPLPQSGT